MSSLRSAGCLHRLRGTNLLSVLVALGLLLLFLIFYSFSSLDSRLGEWISQPHLRPQYERIYPNDNPYQLDFLLRQQTNKTASKTLVIAKLRSESVSWIYEDLKDVINLDNAVYTVDDPTAALSVPVNKGNEAMAYLTYIIDHYEDLPDISIFMHAHSSASHNNELLDTLSAEHVRRLSLEKVIRDGYVNLRCHHNRGCPSEYNLKKLNRVNRYSETANMVAAAFAALFPGEPIPEQLSQPCCAQFAVSKEAIQRRTKKHYLAMRDWLINTEYGNQWSGRVFEYSWHYIFTAKPVLCPSEHMCYCDAYSICFEDGFAWQQYRDLQDARHAIQVEHMALPEGDETQERKDYLWKLMESLQAEVTKMANEAIFVGANPAKRQQILHDEWERLRYEGRPE